MERLQTATRSYTIKWAHTDGQRQREIEKEKERVKDSGDNCNLHKISASRKVHRI